MLARFSWNYPEICSRFSFLWQQSLYVIHWMLKKIMWLLSRKITLIQIYVKMFVLDSCIMKGKLLSHSNITFPLTHVEHHMQHFWNTGTLCGKKSQEGCQFCCLKRAFMQFIFLPLDTLFCTLTTDNLTRTDNCFFAESLMLANIHTTKNSH